MAVESHERVELGYPQNRTRCQGQNLLHAKRLSKDFQNLLANHGEKLKIPSHTLQGILLQAHTGWARCFKKLAKKPRFKGVRNKLNSVPFPDPIKAPKGNHIGIPGLGKVRFHKQELPEGKIKCGRIVRRASGWYLCLFMATDREPIERKDCGKVGIDPGFQSTCSPSPHLTGNGKR